MKKVLAVLMVALVVIGLTSSGLVARAGDNEDLSVFLIEMLILKLKDDDNAKFLFDMSEAVVFLDDDGDVVVSFTTNLPWPLLKANRASALEFMETLWHNFNALHSEVSDAGLYFAIIYDREIMFLADGFSIVDHEDRVSLFKGTGI